MCYVLLHTQLYEELFHFLKMLPSLLLLYSDHGNTLIFTETKHHHLDAKYYLSTMTLFENGAILQRGSV